MNAIFSVALLVSIVLLTVTSPESALTAMQNGAESAVRLSITLAAVYTVWLGIFFLMEKSGLTKTLSKILKKPLKLLFGELGEAEEATVINVSANVLGLGGIATPSGIDAISAFDKRDNRYAKAMLFVLSATSLQLIPTSVISLRAANGSAFPTDVILPSFIASAVSTVCGILLVRIFIKK